MTEMQGYDFKLFKDIFPDYLTFSNWYDATIFAINGEKRPNNIIYQLIYNEYCVSTIAFSEEVFKGKFSNDLYTYCSDFEQECAAIKDLMALTSEEVAEAGTTVLNIADVPETLSSTDVDIANYISQQQKTISKRGKLEVKRERVRNMREFSVRRFLGRFRHLFIRIISPDYVRVYVEDEHQ